MMGLFDKVKDAVTIPAAAKEYGYFPNRAGFICCPFHNERTPSMKLYDHRYHCFGCGAHGSVIDFVAGLFGLSPLDAAKKLDDDFDLRLNAELPNREERDHRQRVRDVRQMFDEWRETMLNQLDVVIRVANLADFDDLTDAEVTALQYREAFEFWSDVLMHGTISGQMDIFRDREGVSRLCGTVLNSTRKKSKPA